MATRTPLEIDTAAARRFAGRAVARHSDHVDALAREIESRMAERLALIRYEPTRILDAGCGTRSASHILRARFPGAEVIAVDYAIEALERAALGNAQSSLLARARRLFRGGRTHAVCADLKQLPLGGRACQMVWANLALGAEHDPMPVFREWQRVLDVGGLVMFSTYGPDTLRELRRAFAAVDAAEHVHRFIDMHDLGDMLGACGFGDPIMDMEYVTLTYAKFDQLARDLRASGQQNALRTRSRALLGRHRWAQMTRAYGAQRGEERLPATIEVVYGLAWKLVPKTDAAGNQVIKFDRARSKTAS